MDRATKLSRIAAIRDAALRIMRERGQWQGEGKDRSLVAEVGDCKIGYTTPFQEQHEIQEAMRYWAAQVGRRVDFGYGLDVWFQRKKVLNVMWNTDAVDDLEILSFKPGEWEWQILKSVRSPA
jgi:hypothetical protein